MPVRFAIIGASRIGAVHTRAVNRNEWAVVAAVFALVDPAAAIFVIAPDMDDERFLLHRLCHEWPPGAVPQA
jgi:predicted dehydrogenase